jgi:hypothetical protein
MTTKTTEYFPSKSRTSDSSLIDFIKEPITEELLKVPGIGKATKLILSEIGVDTTYALLGKYLSLKQLNVEPVEHAERFYLWLKSIGVNSHRCAIVHAISEKMNISFPGIYNEDIYEE